MLIVQGSDIHTGQQVAAIRGVFSGTATPLVYNLAAYIVEPDIDSLKAGILQGEFICRRIGVQRGNHGWRNGRAGLHAEIK
jgi:hypothetical protein